MENKEIKKVFIGTFVDKCEILSFIEQVKERFGVSDDTFLLYHIKEDENVILAMFLGERNYMQDYLMGGPIIMFIAHGSIFTYNGYNRLAQLEHGDENTTLKPNLDYLGKNKLVTMSRGRLQIFTIEKIKDLKAEISQEP
jgi:hypothetical protein